MNPFVQFICLEQEIHLSGLTRTRVIHPRIDSSAWFMLDFKIYLIKAYTLMCAVAHSLSPYHFISHPVNYVFIQIFKMGLLMKVVHFIS